MNYNTPLLEERMAKVRWQNGSLRIVGKHVKQWEFRYLEDQILNGEIVRVQRAVRLGTVKDMPTERAARREARRIVDPINSQSYRPKHKITFQEFTTKWERDVLSQTKPAGRASTKSNLKRLNETFGSIELSSMSTERIQRWIGSQTTLSSKTVSNYVTTLQRIWKSAKAWGYVTGDPFDGLVMPTPELKEQTSFLPEQIKEIISLADEPYKTMFWIVAETGIRGGELCGLFTSDVDLAARMIFVRRSAFQGKLQTPKTGNAVRAFPISTKLAEHIKTYTKTVQAAEPPLLFVTPRGCPYDNGNIVKRALKPILRAMKIDGLRVGLHSFRHSNITAMGSLGIPDSVQLDRAGHGSIRMKRHYAHSYSQDHLRAADALGALFAPSSSAGGPEVRDREVSSPSPADSDSETVQTAYAAGAD